MDIKQYLSVLSQLDSPKIAHKPKNSVVVNWRYFGCIDGNTTIKYNKQINHYQTYV
jgi:hypothetical protein